MKGGRGGRLELALWWKWRGIRRWIVSVRGMGEWEVSHIKLGRGCQLSMYLSTLSGRVIPYGYGMWIMGSVE